MHMSHRTCIWTNHGFLGDPITPFITILGAKSWSKDSKTGRTRCDYQKLYNGLPEKLGRELVKRLIAWRFVRLIHWFLAMGDNLLVTWLNPTPPKKVSGLDVDFWLMSIIHFLLEFISFRVFSNTTRVGDLSQFPTSLTLRMMTLHHLRLGPREVGFNYVTVNSKCLGLKFNHIKKGGM